MRYKNMTTFICDSIWSSLQATHLCCHINKRQKSYQHHNQHYQHRSEVVRRCKEEMEEEHTFRKINAHHKYSETNTVSKDVKRTTKSLETMLHPQIIRRNLLDHLIPLHQPPKLWWVCMLFSKRLIATISILYVTAIGVNRAPLRQNKSYGE